MGYKTRFVNAYGSVSIAYFANLGLPRSGEFFRASFMSKYEKIGLDKTLGTIVLDRMVDMVSMLGLIALAMAIQWHIFKDFLGKRGRDERDVAAVADFLQQVDLETVAFCKTGRHQAFRFCFRNKSHRIIRQSLSFPLAYSIGLVLVFHDAAFCFEGF